MYVSTYLQILKSVPVDPVYMESVMRTSLMSTTVPVNQDGKEPTVIRVRRMF